MTELKKAQLQFARMIGEFIVWVFSVPGRGVVTGDFFRDPRCPYGEPTSLHKSKLAADLYLHIDGEYIDCKNPDPAGLGWEIQQYTVLGLEWESRGGAWGGRFKGKNAGDYNHFSLAFGGYK